VTKWSKIVTFMQYIIYVYNVLQLRMIKSHLFFARCYWNRRFKRFKINRDKYIECKQLMLK